MQNIYYTDDDLDDLDIFADAAERVTAEGLANITLEVFQDGNNLLKALRQGPKQGFVVLDINMPIKSGLEILWEIRRDPALRQFPVIIYSTSSEESIIQRAKELGANFYAVKPNNFNVLVSLITTMSSINWNEFQPGKNDFILANRISGAAF